MHSWSPRSSPCLLLNRMVSMFLAGGWPFIHVSGTGSRDEAWCWGTFSGHDFATCQPCTSLFLFWGNIVQHSQKIWRKTMKTWFWYALSFSSIFWVSCTVRTFLSFRLVDTMKTWTPNDTFEIFWNHISFLAYWNAFAAFTWHHGHDNHSDRIPLQRLWQVRREQCSQSCSVEGRHILDYLIGQTSTGLGQLYGLVSSMIRFRNMQMDLDGTSNLWIWVLVPRDGVSKCFKHTFWKQEDIAQIAETW